MQTSSNNSWLFKNHFLKGRKKFKNLKKKKIEIFFFFEKTQNNDFFISPKWRKTILKMALKSFIISKLDHQMSKS